MDELELELDRKAINDWILMQSKKVQNESQIFSFEEAGPMYHIDKRTPKSFIAMMPRSAEKTEDNTTARITVSNNLIGCLIGYARSDWDFMGGTSKEVTKFNNYRGGYQICELPYTHCLKPTDKLVYDSSRSLEYWLVNYGLKYNVYKPVDLGYIFYSSILLTGKNGADCDWVITAYINHNKPTGMKFTPNKIIEPGSYKAELFFKDNDHTRDCNKETDYIIKKCSIGEYSEAKNQSAALLAYTDKPKPGYFSW